MFVVSASKDAGEIKLGEKLIFYFILLSDIFLIQVAQDVPCAPEILSSSSMYCSQFNKRYCFC